MDVGDSMYGLLLLVGYVLVLALYFAPAMIAFNREHNFRWVVLIMNFIPVLWVPALIWAILPAEYISKDKKPKVSKHEVVLSSDKYSIQDKLDLLFEMYSAGDITKEDFVARKLKLTGTDGEERA